MSLEVNMSDHDFYGIQQLFDYHERVLPPGLEYQGTELRSVSARIPAGQSDYLGELAERWGISKSALAAQLLMTALNEIELRDAGLEQNRAKAAAL
jgi:hypothetical protein